MTGRWVWALALGLAVVSRNAGALQPKIVPGAEDWVFTGDIPPFSLGVVADFGTGGSGLHPDLGPHPGNLGANVDYRDPARGMVVIVRVDREVRSTYLNHRIEADFRKLETGQMQQSGTVLRFGQPVLYHCVEPPDCTHQAYGWRSGADLVVDVEASAHRVEETPGVEPRTVRIACPEPTEILQAYLQRYPSSLQPFSDSASRRQEWLRDMAAYKLATAKYELDQVDVATVQSQDSRLLTAESRLSAFAGIRESLFDGPDAGRERQRLLGARALPGPAGTQELRRIWEEYHQWWQSHVGVPVQLFPTPGP